MTDFSQVRADFSILKTRPRLPKRKPGNLTRNPQVRKSLGHFFLEETTK